MQHCVIKFVSVLQPVGGFLWVFRIPPPIKLGEDCLSCLTCVLSFCLFELLKLCPLMVAILDGGQGHRTQF